MKPLIGLTSYREQASWGVWNQPADLLPVMYADAIVRAGGVPVVLPPATDDPDADAVFATVMRAGGVASSTGSLRGAVTAVQRTAAQEGLSAVAAVGQTTRRVPRGSFISMQNSYSYTSDLTRKITAVTG